MNNVLEQINKSKDKMSKGHKKIAEFILNQYDKAAFLTASRLGSEVGVSESTVVRFANSLGYEGFPELQDAIEEIVKVRITALQRYELTFDKMANKDILSKVVSSDISGLKNTLDAVDKTAFDDAVNTILGARTIYVIGVRSSYALASFLGYYINLMFDNVKIVQIDSMSEMFEQILRIKDTDVAIGITFPRYSARTSKALEYAKNRGAKVVGITDSEQSPIVKYSDVNLYAKTDMISFVDSLVAPLSLINALIIAIGMKKKDEITDVFSNLENIWDEYSVYNKGLNDE